MSDEESVVRSPDSDAISENDTHVIKPPQAAKSEYRSKDKKKHKKHSHERKYKDKHREYSREDTGRRRMEYRMADNKYEDHRGKDYRREYRGESSKGQRFSPEHSSDSRKQEQDLRNRILSRRTQKDSFDPREKNEKFYGRESHYGEDYDYQHSRSKRHRHHPVDAEAEARRKKFLEADRDEMKRKEIARQELEERRKQHKQKEVAMEVSLSPPDRKKSRYESSEERKIPEDVVMLSSERSHGEEEEEEEDREEVDLLSDSNSSEHSEEFEISPAEQLEKSQERSSRSQSKIRSRTESRSRSRSSSSSHSSSHSTNTRTDTDSRSEHSDDAEKNEPIDPESSPKKDEKSSEKVIKEEVKKEEDKIDDEEAVELAPYFPALQGCRSVEEFQCLNRIEEGTYGVVYRARDKRTDEVVALKRLKMEKEKEGFPITSLREINTLLKGQHPNIVTVREIVVGSNMDKIFIVMDYVEHDLKSLIETMKHKKQVFLPGEVKCLIQQLIRAVAHLHDNWILHRDLKTSNLLLSHKGILKVGDFGLAREYGSPLKEYTSIVVTLWYRAPELLLGCKEYSTHIDVWSVGCIFAELLAMTALFPGKSEVDQLNRIFKDLGTPNDRIWPGYHDLPLVKKMTFTDYPVSQLRKKFANVTSELGLSLLQGLLTYDPKQRLTAEAALKHNYFKEIPLPIDPAMFPTWPAKSEVGWRRAIATSPKPPSGGMQYKKLGVDDENTGFSLSGTYASYSESRKMQMGSGFSLKF